MRHPLRENLQVADAGDTDWIYWSRCRFQYRRADQDWREFCKVRWLAPADAGSLMSVLDSGYRLRQFYYPSGVALVDTDCVENRPQEAARQSRIRS
jgi:hypothetical protein